MICGKMPDKQKVIKPITTFKKSLKNCVVDWHYTCALPLTYYLLYYYHHHFSLTYSNLAASLIKLRSFWQPAILQNGNCLIVVVYSHFGI